ncbi:MAG: HAD-IA family hydrolase [Parvularculaceae bacterium]|nr:HAD-IA family hydrolase [Parvularculaceae bacterium]
MTHRFKAVIFDFGGVFTTSPVENFAAFEKEHGLPDRFIGGVIKSRLHDGAFARFERAELTPDEFDRLFAEETRAAGFEISGRDFARLLDVAPKPEMTAALRAVKAAGFKTGCITNNFPSIESDGSPRLEARKAELAAIYAAFDSVIESSKAGVRKPEPRIYEMMLERLALPASACIFLDDLGVNLKPARDMGMTTIKVPFGDVGPAIGELSRLLGLDFA